MSSELLLYIYIVREQQRDKWSELMDGVHALLLPGVPLPRPAKLYSKSFVISKILAEWNILLLTYVLTTNKKRVPREFQDFVLFNIHINYTDTTLDRRTIKRDLMMLLWLLYFINHFFLSKRLHHIIMEVKAGHAGSFFNEEFYTHTHGMEL